MTTFDKGEYHVCRKKHLGFFHVKHSSDGFKSGRDGDFRFPHQCHSFGGVGKAGGGYGLWYAGDFGDREQSVRDEGTGARTAAGDEEQHGCAGHRGTGE